jgi:hypothetical protein
MPTSWSDPIDLYCERTGLSFWAEPLNAMTNVAFLIAAGFAFLQWRQSVARDLPVLALIVITGIIGIGSFMFHTVATRGAELLDVIPIALFVCGYLLLALLRFVHLRTPIAIMILIGFFVLSQVVGGMLPDRFLNGSGAYLFPLTALIVVGWRVGSERGSAILAAGALFAVSLVFRSIDQTVCHAFPWGTHFIWHLLNAAVLFILLRTALIASSARSAAPAR